MVIWVPPGAIGFTIYFGIDAYYLGGIEGYAEDCGEATKNMPNLQFGW
jgi:hypothetical protein